MPSSGVVPPLCLGMAEYFDAIRTVPFDLVWMSPPMVSRSSLVLALTVLMVGSALAAQAPGPQRRTVNPADVKACSSSGNDALAACSRVIEAESDKLKLAAAYNQRGLAQSRRGEFDKALADYDLAARLVPNNPTYLGNRAVIRLRLKQYEPALADYLEALRQAPRIKRRKQIGL